MRGRVSDLGMLEGKAKVPTHHIVYSKVYSGLWPQLPPAPRPAHESLRRHTDTCYKLALAVSFGVAAPDAGCDAATTPGDGTSMPGFRR